MKTTKKQEITVSFGKKTINFDEIQAKEYIKLGIKAEKYKSVLSILQALSERENVSVDEYVLQLKATKDQELKSRLLEKVNGDEELAEKLFKLETGNKVEQTQDEMAKVCEHFKEFKCYDDLPYEVKILSETNNISLFDALLRYLFFQTKQIEKEQKNREKNKQRAVGSLKTNQADYGLTYISAMLKAINN